MLCCVNKARLPGWSGVLYLFWKQSAVAFWGKEGLMSHWPGNNCQISSDEEIRAMVGVASLKEALRLTQMAMRARSWVHCGRERVGQATPQGRLPRKTPRRFPTVTSGCPELSWGWSLLVMSIVNLFSSLCPPGPFKLTALPWFSLGPFFKTKQTNKKDIEKIPRVLPFPGNTSWCVLLPEVRWRTGKKDYSQWKQVSLFVQMLLNNM